MNKIISLLYVLMISLPVFSIGQNEYESANSKLDGKSFAGIAFVSLEGEFCDVEIEGTNRDRVQVRVLIESGAAGVYYDVEGDTLRLWVEYDNFMPKWGRNRIQLEIPDEIQCTVKNSSGNITISDHHTDIIDLETASGNIQVTGCSGRKKVSSASGNIELLESDGDVQGNSSSGNQDYQDVIGSIRGDSASGNLRFTDIAGDIRASTSSGTVSLNNVEALEIEIQSTSGSQELQRVEGAFTMESSSGDIRGERVTILGDSSFRTVSGGIRLEPLNSEACSFELKSTTGSLHALSRRGGKKLSLPGGGIGVRAVSNSGSIRIE